METLDTRIGIANLGNTCFLNVILQMLRLCPAITDIMLPNSIRIREHSKKGELFSGLQTLIRDFWRTAPGANDHPVLVPRGFLQSLHRVIQECDCDWYRPGQQCDSAEALQFILEGIHDSIYKCVEMRIKGDAMTDEERSHNKSIQSWIDFYAKEYSPIIQTFHGQSQIRIECYVCENVSERYEPWLMLKAPIPGSQKAGVTAPTLHDCIRTCFHSETIDDYACDRCKKSTRAEMRTSISRFPKFLILSLKRFTNSNQKVRGKIEWDLDNIDFGRVAAFRRDPFGNPHFTTKYRTVAVVEHWGSSHGGHYLMYNRQGEKWYRYDDNSVSEVAPDEVVNQDSYIALLVPNNSFDQIYKEQKTAIDMWRREQVAEEA